MDDSIIGLTGFGCFFFDMLFFINRIVFTVFIGPFLSLIFSDENVNLYDEFFGDFETVIGC